MRWSAACLLMLATACATSDPAARFGPGAVVSGESGEDMEAAMSGTVLVTSECVLLETPSSEVLLVFREGDVSWDSDAMALHFEDAAGTVTLEDGAHVTLGGGGFSASEDGASTNDDVAELEWVNRPDEGCWRDVRFRGAFRAGSRIVTATPCRSDGMKAA